MFSSLVIASKKSLLSVAEPAPIAVLKSEAFKAEIVLFALILRNVIASGLVAVNKFEPRVVAPNEVLPVVAFKPLLEPDQLVTVVFPAKASPAPVPTTGAKVEGIPDRLE